MVGSSPEGAFAAALRNALERKQMTLTELRAQLKQRGHVLSLTTLSFWRSGQRMPERESSLQAIPVLEELLGLSAGALGRYVSGPVARRIGHAEAFDRLIDYPIEEMATDARFKGENDITRLVTHATLTVGRDRQVRSTRMRRVVMANRDGVEGYSVFLGTNETQGAESYRFEAIAGCTIHEDVHPARNVRQVHLRFPRPLQSGESTITEVEVTHAADPEIDIVDDYEIVAEQKLEEILLWVRFDEQAIPNRCWIYFSEGDLKHEWPVDVDGTFSVHYRQRDFGPGALGIRWAW